ncbi:hypothetical protein BE04_13690 [Sorangium cellulosum]|uniref:Uncharacterized protein n=2 Tax=Sorangium cellulosum TaxID=56 RepID=A0A150RFS7_SORCE|nr:hypothetical protein [Sorangium cellulosum]AGP41933.1 hypothetical protein SCE1572_50030 [Sorangium cellulosum So0157-2]KYF59256.1 hypothetical protein BE04_13690 [Sorangium cellulosum]KYF79001.1 hypothetical protein BE18_44530 [Sorangium cellulosum]KYF87871.1 hypothetical protein BE20_24675 [Sorangium cellulosum]KYG08680.1 hypothetical protein BE21_22290 [Sorangium cellulosum]
MENQKATQQTQSADIEGEGNHTADRRYREGVQRSVKDGKIEQHAEEAAEALDGPEGDALREAQEATRRGRPS